MQARPRRISRATSSCSARILAPAPSPLGTLSSPQPSSTAAAPAPPPQIHSTPPPPLPHGGTVVGRAPFGINGGQQSDNRFVTSNSAYGGHNWISGGGLTRSSSLGALGGGGGSPFGGGGGTCTAIVTAAGMRPSSGLAC